MTAATAPWLVVGLGNPGLRYAGNRHNIGFMAVDRLCDRQSPPPSWSEKWKGLHASVRVGGERCVLLKPMTYMNLSGECVGPAARFFRVPPTQLLVIHDEVDFPFARLAVKRGGGHGGHNGLRDLIAKLGTAEFPRIRLGVGRPVHGEVSDHVLSDFSSDEQIELPDLLDRAVEALSCVVREGVTAAMNRCNPPTKKKKPGSPKKSSAPAGEPAAPDPREPDPSS